MSDINQAKPTQKYCSSCGELILREEEICPKCGVRQAPVSPPPVSDEKYCFSCGALILKNAEICPKCGVRQQINTGDVSTKWITLFLLSFFLGEFGVDRFFVGKIGTGILKLITFGGCGIWWLVDWILIACEKFTDSNGNVVKRD